MSELGMTITTIATQIAEAVLKDESPESGGCDLSAGMFGPHLSKVIRDLAQSIVSTAPTPIDMVLHCPRCRLQHIDADAPHDHPELDWRNPPHRSHLCADCGYIWRPADVPTNGVRAVKTRGKNDSPLGPSPSRQAREHKWRILNEISPHIEWSVSKRPNDLGYLNLVATYHPPELAHLPFGDEIKQAFYRVPVARQQETINRAFSNIAATVFFIREHGVDTYLEQFGPPDDPTKEPKT